MIPIVSRTGFIAFGLILVLGVLVTSCKADERRSTAAGGPSDLARPADPGVVHVHGLGINPKDGALFAATHTGLFRIQDGRAERIGDRYQDTMGFTVTGPDNFLGSGHPDMRDYTAGKLPALLGLVESKDAGLTWKARSVEGKVDFHGLSLSHGRIYGFDSTGGRLMVSSDGKNWQTQSQLEILSFAVSPQQEQNLLGATDTGLRVSRDGGKSWQTLSGPPLILLSWPNAARLFGLDAKGGVFSSEDAGQSWRVIGSLEGVPEAFLADGGLLYASVRERGIFVSSDDGATWRLFY